MVLTSINKRLWYNITALIYICSGGWYNGSLHPSPATLSWTQPQCCEFQCYHDVCQLLLMHMGSEPPPTCSIRDRTLTTYPPNPAPDTAMSGLAKEQNKLLPLSPFDRAASWSFLMPSYTAGTIKHWREMDIMKLWWLRLKNDYHKIHLLYNIIALVFNLITKKY